MRTAAKKRYQRQLERLQNYGDRPSLFEVIDTAIARPQFTTTRPIWLRCGRYEWPRVLCLVLLLTTISRHCSLPEVTRRRLSAHARKLNDSPPENQQYLLSFWFGPRELSQET